MVGAVLSLQNIERALERSSSHASAQAQRAAVVVALRESPEVEVLMIRRAEHPLDPWSGHMAFPGGRADNGEAPRTTAVRETMEELRLNLNRWGRPIGLLNPQDTLPGLPPLTIFPFVYAIDPRAPKPQPAPSEVAEAIWIPLAPLLDLEQREVYQLEHHGHPVEVPSVVYEGRRIWGLTLRMLDELRLHLANDS